MYPTFQGRRGPYDEHEFCAPILIIRSFQVKSDHTDGVKDCRARGLGVLCQERVDAEGLAVLVRTRQPEDGYLSDHANTLFTCEALFSPASSGVDLSLVRVVTFAR